MRNIKDGDLVRWKTEYAQDETERAQVFVTAECGDDGKCYIMPAFWDRDKDGAVIPSQLVKTEYLELFDVSNLETMTARECWTRYGHGNDAENSASVHYHAAAGFELFCYEMKNDGIAVMCCDIFENGELFGQWYADTFDDAVKGAITHTVND